jgi:hypothetical protein
MVSGRKIDPLGLLTLREIRSFVRRSSARGGVAFFGLLYVLVSVFLGGMVVLGNIRGGYTVATVWGGARGIGAWNYPGLLVVAPWGVVSLPFFATFAMIVVAVGVGYGMTVAFLLAVRLLRPRASPAGQSAAGTLAGLTPAMISLVTLGACCSTTAAATAGVGLVAQASGTSVENLLANNWYLGVFQIVIVWVALLAQEMLLVVYAGLFGPAALGGSATPRAHLPGVSARRVTASVFRGALLGAGVVWCLTVLAEWTTVSPGSAGPGLWFQWVLQHELVGGVAVAVALFPEAALRGLRRAREGPARLGLALLVLAGASVVLWLPPPLPAWGLDALGNQLLGAFGAPASWGAIAPGAVGGLALYLRWGFEYLLLPGFLLAAGLAPDRALGWLTDAPASPTRGEPVPHRPALPGPDGAPLAVPLGPSPRSSEGR